jgi:hypothetical protein
MLELVTPYSQFASPEIKGWYEVEGDGVTIKDLNAGVYVLSLRDGVKEDGSFGCLRTYELIIDLNEEIWIPNIITPNNDTFNDTFFIRNLPADSKLIISNRWGKEVYSSSNYLSELQGVVNPQTNKVEYDYVGGWDGGSEESGVYYYRLQVKGGKVYTGWLEVQRGPKN